MCIQQSTEVQEVFNEQTAESGMLGGLGKVISTGQSEMKHICNSVLYLKICLHQSLN